MSTTVPRASWTERLPFIATIAGSLAIAGALLAVSFGHIRTFALLAGAAEWEAIVIAATVDALVVLAVAAIGHAKRTGHHPPAVAKVALLVGIVATTGANLHYGLSHGWMGIVVSLWVPVAAELAYQLAMAAVRMGAGGHAPGAAAGGHRDEEDGRPVVCTSAIPVATLAATMPPRPRPAAANCGGHLIPVATVTRPLADLRPAICGATMPLAEVTFPVDTRPAICGRLVAVEDVAMPAPLADLRPDICTATVTVAEVMAKTSVAKPAPAPRPRPAKRPVATPTVAAADREDTVLEWLTAPDAPADRLATAAGADIVALLAASGQGHVSARTGRRILADVRQALGKLPETAPAG